MCSLGDSTSVSQMPVRQCFIERLKICEFSSPKTETSDFVSIFVSQIDLIGCWLCMLFCLNSGFLFVKKVSFILQHFICSWCDHYEGISKNKVQMNVFFAGIR